MRVGGYHCLHIEFCHRKLVLSTHVVNFGGGLVLYVGSGLGFFYVIWHGDVNCSMFIVPVYSEVEEFLTLVVHCDLIYLF